MIIITNETDSVVIPRGLGPNANGGSVDSVNGKVGEVVLDAEDVHALPDTAVIPTKTSELTNDSGFVNEDDLADYAKIEDVPTKTSDLTNDSGFVDTEGLADYAKIEDIPTKTSDLTNDSGFITEHQSLTAYTKTEDFATINGQSITNGGNIEVGTPEIPVFTIAEDEEGEYYLVEGAETVFNAIHSGDTRYNLDGITYNPEGVVSEDDYAAVIFINGERMCDVEIYIEDGEYIAEIDNFHITGTEVATATRLGLVKIGSGISVAADGTISAGGGGDYTIVSQLPETPVEGKRVYLLGQPIESTVYVIPLSTMVDTFDIWGTYGIASLKGDGTAWVQGYNGGYSPIDFEFPTKVIDGIFLGINNDNWMITVNPSIITSVDTHDNQYLDYSSSEYFVSKPKEYLGRNGAWIETSPIDLKMITDEDRKDVRDILTDNPEYFYHMNLTYPFNGTYCKMMCSLSRGSDIELVGLSNFGTTTPAYLCVVIHDDGSYNENFCNLQTV